MYISKHVVHLLLLSLYSTAHRAHVGLRPQFGAESPGERASLQSSSELGHKGSLLARGSFERLLKRVLLLDKIQFGDTEMGYIHKRTVTLEEAERIMGQVRLEIDRLKDPNGPVSAQSLLRSKDITLDSKAGRMADGMFEVGPEYLAHAHRTLKFSLNQVEELRASGHAEVAYRYEKMAYDWWHHFIKWFEAWMQAAMARQEKKAASAAEPETGKVHTGGEKAGIVSKTGSKSSKDGSKSGENGSKRGSRGQSGLRKGFLG